MKEFKQNLMIYKSPSEYIQDWKLVHQKILENSKEQGFDHQVAVLL